MRIEKKYQVASVMGRLGHEVHYDYFAHPKLIDLSRYIFGQHSLMNVRLLWTFYNQISLPMWLKVYIHIRELGFYTPRSHG